MSCPVRFLFTCGVTQSLFFRVLYVLHHGVYVLSSFTNSFFCHSSVLVIALMIVFAAYSVFCRRRSRSSSVRRRSGRYESARSDSTRDRYLERERRQSSRSAPRDVRHSRRRPRSRSSGSRGRSSRHSGSRLSSRSHHRSRTRSPSNKEHHNEEKRLEELRRKEEERRRQEEERRLKEEEEKRR